MVEQIQTRLIELHQQGKRVVALVDEAQALSDEALETLRLFGNLETEQTKLLQIVLIGNLNSMFDSRSITCVSFGSGSLLTPICAR